MPFTCPQNTPVIAYRFLERKYAEELMELGKLRISLLNFYHKTENSTIQDSQEGISRAYLKRFKGSDRDPANKEIFRNLESAGYYFDGVSDMTVINARSSRSIAPIYALCLSLDSKCKKWMKGKNKKDTAISINNIVKFADTIHRSNPNLFKRGMGMPVNYSLNNTNLMNGPLPRANAFIKRPSFSDEQEYRIIFEPRSSSPQQHIDIICPEIIPLLKMYTRE